MLAFVYQIAVLFCCAFVTEAITELIIKGDIFKALREFLKGTCWFFRELLACAYCFSFWATFLVLSVYLLCFGRFPLPFSGLYFFDFFASLFIVQRLSNVIHGSIDKYFDTRKDIRFIRISETSSGDSNNE